VAQCFMCGISVILAGYCHPCLHAARQQGQGLPHPSHSVPGGKALKFTATTRVRFKPPPEMPRKTAWERLSGPDPY